MYRERVLYRATCELNYQLPLRHNYSNRLLKSKQHNRKQTNYATNRTYTALRKLFTGPRLREKFGRRQHQNFAYRFTAAPKLRLPKSHWPASRASPEKQAVACRRRMHTGLAQPPRDWPLPDCLCSATSPLLLEWSKRPATRAIDLSHRTPTYLRNNSTWPLNMEHTD